MGLSGFAILLTLHKKWPEKLALIPLEPLKYKVHGILPTTGHLRPLAQWCLGAGVMWLSTLGTCPECPKGIITTHCLQVP